jgi:hypothetical protein
MAAVKKSGSRIESPSLGTFLILYKSGERDHVRAHSFSYQPKQGDLIKFYDSDTAETDEILLRASEVASVIASSHIVEAPLVLEIHNQVKNLEARVGALENNLAAIVTRAVDAALERRGL